MDTEYTAAVARYLRDREAAEAEARAARGSYDASTAALDAAVEAAREWERETAAAAAKAAALVAETDAAVAALWRGLGGFVGEGRAGAVPRPVAAEASETEAVRARVDRAARLLELARQGELPVDAPRRGEAAAAGAGAAAAALAVVLAAWILAAEPAATLRRAFAAAVLFGGVAAGPLVLGVWSSVRYRVRPRPTQTLACVAAALVATCALAGAFLRGV